LQKHALSSLVIEMIETDRLKLIPLSLGQLESLLSQQSQVEKEIGITLSKNITVGRVEKAIKMKLEKMEDASEAYLNWITYWLLVIKSTSLGVGLLGFKGFPNENGFAEIGYGIDPAHRSMGYVTEAVIGMVEWAFIEPACQTIIAPGTQKSNPASNRVLEKVGMQVYEETGEIFSWKLDQTSFYQR
jgi:[ribosomal protein S5]-alanine N-acetyltransferase